MALRKFWKEHPVLLQVCAVIMLVLSPVLLPAMLIFQACKEVWEDRGDIKRMYRYLWRYITGDLD